MQYHEMMMNRTTLISLLFAVLAAASAAADHSPQYPPNWTEIDALVAIGSVDTASQSAELNRLARSGDSSSLLEGAIAVHENTEWPAPARESVLFGLARSLGDLPPGQVDREVTDFLTSLSSDVRIAHPDHPGNSIPMFNIAAAATGATFEWDRQLAALEASDLIGQGQLAWLEAYIQATPVQRNGFRRSAAAFTNQQLYGLAEAAMRQAPTHSELAVIASMAGLRLGDTGLFTRSLTWNDHYSRVEMIRLSGEVFQHEDLRIILLDTVKQAPAPTASLVIAELAPALLYRTEVQNLMFELLGDPQLGSSAALVLSNHDSSRTQARLTEMSRGAPGLAAKRARLALAAQEAK